MRPLVDLIDTARCRLFGCRGWIAHERDIYGVRWIGLRCVRCGELKSKSLSIVQDMSLSEASR